MDPAIELLKLKAKVRDMLSAQQAYFKSGKDIQLLKVSKAIESEVKEMVSDKPNKVSQATMEFLAR